jgi:hypothetical protein
MIRAALHVDTGAGFCADRFNRRDYEGEYIRHDDRAALLFQKEGVR